MFLSLEVLIGINVLKKLGVNTKKLIGMKNNCTVSRYYY